MTQKRFLELLAAYSAGGLIGRRNTRRMLAYAAGKGISLAGLGARAAIPAAGLVPASVQSATPFAVGAGLGVAALGTPQGQQLLAAAEEHGRQSRILFERAQQELMTTPQRIEAAIASAPVSPPSDIVPRLKKRAVSKFNRAVSQGMKAVKSSTSYGKKGKISNAKKAFAAVVKIASSKRKGKKAPRSGIRAKIFHSMRALKRGR